MNENQIGKICDLQKILKYQSENNRRAQTKNDNERKLE